MSDQDLDLNQQEQYYIQFLVNAISMSISIDKFISNYNKICEINKRLNSPIIHYYCGVYFKDKNLNGTPGSEISKNHFESAIKIEPLFTASYYEMANYYFDIDNKLMEKEKLEFYSGDLKAVQFVIKRNDRPNFKKAEEYLMKIFNKVTINYEVPERTRCISFKDNLRICSILSPVYMADKSFDKVSKLYNVILKKFENMSSQEILSVHNYIICWKNMHIDLGQIHFLQNEFKESFETYKNGFKYGLGIDTGKTLSVLPFSKSEVNNEKSLYIINKYLLEACMLSRHYMSEWNKLPITVNDIYKLFLSKNEIDELNIIHDRNQLNIRVSNIKDLEKVELKFRPTLNFQNPGSQKIKIGYVSPDFNKNAVGLFVGPYLNDYSDQFEIYCYYTNENFDEYTLMFKKCKVIWKEVGNLSIKELYKCIMQDNLDIVFDLIGHGHGNSMEVFKMIGLSKKLTGALCPLIITHLGYPDSTMLDEIDYRLVDKITDPHKSFDITEKLLYLPKCFLCYYPFLNEKVPVISVSRRSHIAIGILNKGSKHSAQVIKDWKYILTECKNCILYIKLDQNPEYQKQLYKDLPQKQLHYLPFTSFLQEYYDIYNEVDFCLDTYPYSGTTTTCSALYMGVPTFAIYEPTNIERRHASNVSASILINCGFENFVKDSRLNYKKDIVEYIKEYTKNPDTNEIRYSRRDKFLKAMDPKEYMKDYEELLIKTLNEHGSNVVSKVEIKIEHGSEIKTECGSEIKIEHEIKSNQIIIEL